MKKFILYSFLLFGLSLFSQNQSTLNISETEKQEMINELEEMRTTFYSVIKSKYSHNMGNSDKDEIAQLYSDFNKEWNKKINSLSKKYAVEPKQVIQILAKNGSKKSIH